MKIFSSIFSLILFGFILTFGNFANASDRSRDSCGLRDEMEPNPRRLIPEFRTILKSEAGKVNIADHFMVYRNGAQRTLACILLASLIRNDPIYFIDEVVLTYAQGNYQFQEFMDQTIYIESEKVNVEQQAALEGVFTLKLHILKKGLFGILLREMKSKILDAIINEVSSLAIILCPYKAERISYLIGEFPTLGRLESDMDLILYQYVCSLLIHQVRIPLLAPFNLTTDKDLKKVKRFLEKVVKEKFENSNITLTELSFRYGEICLFGNLLGHIFNPKNIDTTSFLRLESNTAVLRTFFASPKGDKLFEDLLKKGLFFALANHSEDKNIKRITRIIYARLETICDVARTKRFWSLLYILKEVEQIDRLAMILFRYSFLSQEASEKFYEIVRDDDVAFMREIVNIPSAWEALSRWQLEFCNFISPLFLHSKAEQRVEFLLHDINQSEEGILYSMIGHAMYSALIERKQFNQAFADITVYVSPNILKVNERLSESVSKMETFMEVYNSVSSIKKGPKNFFYQYVGFYISKEMALLSRKFLKTIPQDFKRSPAVWEAADISCTREIASKVFFILFDLVQKKQVKVGDADFISNLHEDVFKPTVEWIKTLDNSHFNDKITVDRLRGKTKLIQHALESLTLDE
jgi:hypothetical protein